jgi:hypothetical protein
MHFCRRLPMMDTFKYPNGEADRSAFRVLILPGQKIHNPFYREQAGCPSYFALPIEKLHSCVSPFHSDPVIKYGGR